MGADGPTPFTGGYREPADRVPDPPKLTPAQADAMFEELESDVDADHIGAHGATCKMYLTLIRVLTEQGYGAAVVRFMDMRRRDEEDEDE